MFSSLPELDDFTEPIAAHVYCGRRILETVVISPEYGRYVIRNAKETYLESTRTAALAIRLADLYLEGYLRGMAASQEVIRVPTLTLWRDRRNGGTTESHRRDREHDQGTAEDHRPD